MMETKPSTFVVLGAGSWGTALAILLARNGHNVTLWGRNSEVMEKMSSEGCNARYLPGAMFPQTLKLTSNLEQAFSQVRDVLVVVPSNAFRSVLELIKPFLPAGANLTWATKGLEQGTNKLLHQVVMEVLGTDLQTAVVSGPTFAKEVARGLPTAVTVSSASNNYANHIAHCLHNETFRPYTSNDVIGVELGGGLKNVLAIAAGIADGLGFGANTRAALVTRGLVEMMRLGVALEGQKETFMGLAGLGDLVLTCTDDTSRNRRLGLALGRGQTIDDALASIDQVVEGVLTTREVYELAQSLAVDMPITEQVYQVLYENCSPKDAVHALLVREQKPEMV
jgi:glycerol-3-phosphate dehydrogenase (NAD(P)+)